MKNYFCYQSSNNRSRLFTTLDKADAYTTNKSKVGEIWIFAGTRFARLSELEKVGDGAYRQLSGQEIEENERSKEEEERYYNY